MACRPFKAADPDSQEISAITDSANRFVEAFHKGDAKAVGAFWMPANSIRSGIERGICSNDCVVIWAASYRHARFA